MKKIILMIGMIFIVGCSGKNIEISNGSCHYPEFPKRNKEVKQKLYDLKNKEVDKWINKIIIYKKKIKVLQNGKN